MSCIPRTDIMIPAPFFLLLLGMNHFLKNGMLMIGFTSHGKVPRNNAKRDSSRSPSTMPSTSPPFLTKPAGSLKMTSVAVSIRNHRIQSVNSTPFIVEDKRLLSASTTSRMCRSIFSSCCNTFFRLSYGLLVDDILDRTLGTYDGGYQLALGSVRFMIEDLHRWRAFT